jgi:hypothetical protein
MFLPTLLKLWHFNYIYLISLTHCMIIVDNDNYSGQSQLQWITTIIVDNDSYNGQ